MLGKAPLNEPTKETEAEAWSGHGEDYTEASGCLSRSTGKGIMSKGLRWDSRNDYIVLGAGELAWQLSVLSASLEVPAPTLERTHNLLEL